MRRKEVNGNHRHQQRRDRRGSEAGYLWQHDRDDEHHDHLPMSPSQVMKDMPDNRRLPQRPMAEFQNDYCAKFDKQNLIGQGFFAKVYVCQQIGTRKPYAIKKVNRERSMWHGRDMLIEDEVANLECLRGADNVVQLYEIFVDNRDCLLVLEYMEGKTLLDQLMLADTRSGYTEKDARDVVRDLLTAVKHCHERRIAHRDLNLSNLLLPNRHANTRIKVAGFGFSRKLLVYNGLQTLCGEPGYIAPEVLQLNRAYDTKCDMWSVGVILYELLGGCAPFHDTNLGNNASSLMNNTFDLTRRGLQGFPLECFEGVSQDAKNLIASMLTRRPAKRISVHMALEHDWVAAVDSHALEQRDLNPARVRLTRIKAAVRALTLVRGLEHTTKKLNDDFMRYWNEKEPHHRRVNNTFSRDDDMRGLVDPMESLHIARTVSMAPAHSLDGQKFNQCYQEVEILHEGSYADIKLVRHRGPGQRQYSAKVVSHLKLAQVVGDHDASLITNEIDILTLLRGGPFIVRLHDFFRNEPGRTCMIMDELKGGDLLQYVVRKSQYTEHDVRNICKNLFQAINYMHGRLVAHRDLRPDVILLGEKSDSSTMKIADFSHAKKVFTRRSLTTICGTSGYMAPEVQNGRYDKRADLWSCGIIMFQLLGGYLPFPRGETEGELPFNQSNVWETVSTPAKKLLGQLLSHNPDDRISAEKALVSSWMTPECEQLLARDLSATKKQLKGTMPEKLKSLVRAVMVSRRLLNISRGSSSSFSPMDEEKEPEPPQTFENTYNKGEEIMASMFLSVFRATHRESGRKFTGKSYKRSQMHEIDVVGLEEEIALLRQLQHSPHVVQLLNVFHEPQFSYLVVADELKGHLLDEIKTQECIPEPKSKRIFKELLETVKHCHERRIANRRLIPKQIFLVETDNGTEVRVSDFGLAKVVPHENGLKTKCGHIHYVAPEVLAPYPAYDVMCDMWTLGVTLFFILGGYRPFLGDTDFDICLAILANRPKFKRLFWKHISVEARQLIRRMLTLDPSKRITAAEALQSPWFNSG